MKVKSKRKFPPSDSTSQNHDKQKRTSASSSILFFVRAWKIVLNVCESENTFLSKKGKRAKNKKSKQIFTKERVEVD